MKIPRVLLVPLIMLILGCTLGSPPPAAPTATPPKPGTAVPPPVAPTATPTPVAASPTCVPPQGELPAIVAPTFADYPAQILQFLNAGATLAQLEAALPPSSDGDTHPTQVVQIDLTGNGQQDFAVSLYDFTSSFFPPPGALLVYVCENNQFRLAHSAFAEEFMSGPKIWYAQDLTADGKAELVTALVSCGAHTCYEEFHLLAWDGAAFRNHLSGEEVAQPYPDAIITDADGDGIYRLEITAGGVGSAGAGPQRPHTYIWDYVPAAQSWTLTEIIIPPPVHRIHALHDADAALARGDFDTALTLYSRVIADRTFEDWGEGADEMYKLGAFARYRAVQIYLLQERPEQVQGVLFDLSMNYAAGSEFYPYVEMAHAYADAYQSGGAEHACATVIAFAEANAVGVLEPLSWPFYGYENPDYTAADMCPE